MNYFYSAILKIVFLLSIYNTFAEGTKELMPQANSFGHIQIFDRGRTFATYNATEAYRLHIHISSIQEKIYFGFNQPNNDVYFRLKDPDGNIVLGPNLLPSNGTGFISNYTEAVAGPQQVVGATGYDAIEYQPSVTGDFYIEFNPTNATTIPANASTGGAQRIFDFFDITVANQNTIKKGRLWSKAWDINSKAINNPIDATMYIYSTDSIVTAIDFNGMQPYGALITANSTGVKNTGNIVEDRKSVLGDFSLPEYKIFLNNPDPVVYPSGFGFKLNSKSKISGCDKSNLTLTFNFNRPGATEIILDLNSIDGYQPNSSDLKWTQSVIKGPNSFTWDGLDGLGNPIPNSLKIPVIINYLDNATHLPLYDVEANPKGYQVSLIRPSGPAPQIYWDDSNIKSGNAIDGLVNASGCEQAKGCHRWTNRGNNNCPNNCPETINTWWFPSYILDTLDFNLPTTLIDADNRILSKDTTICISSLPFILSATTNGNNYIWSAQGTFSSNTSLTATYTPSLQEIEDGKSKLILTSSLTSICPSVKDSITIYYTKLPKITKTLPGPICINALTTTIDITLENYQSYTINNLSGTYDIATKIYNISNTDRTNQFIYFTVVADNGMVCQKAYDTIKVSLLPLPIIQPLTDTLVCLNTDIALHATSVGNQINWYNINSPTNLLSNDAVITINQNESYVVKSTSTQSCVSFDTLLISKYQLPLVTFDIPTCFKNSDWVKANYSTTGLPSIKHAWYKNNVLLNSDFLADSIFLTNTGTYLYKMYTDQCERVESFTINAPSYYTIIDTIFTCIQKNIAPHIYSNTNATWVNINNVTIASNYNFNSSEYIYTFYKTIEGCDAKDSVFVSVLPQPMLSVKDTSLCIGSKIQYKPSIVFYDKNKLTYQWQLNNQFINGDSIMQIEKPGNYSIQVSHANCSVQSNFIVKENPIPVSTLESHRKICFQDSLTTRLYAGLHYSYNWDNGKSNDPFYTANNPGLHFVTVQNEFGCSSKDSILLIDVCPPKLYVASAFTPNGDGLNDLFKINYENISEFKIVVYNRWGEVIFVSEDPNEFWNGEYKNEQMPMGVYPFVVTYDSLYEEYKGPYKISGSITLIR